MRADGSRYRIAASDCHRFAVMDPAGTEPTQNSRPCYTVIQVWDITPAHDMLLVHQYRAQVQTPDATDAAERIARQFNVEFLGVEKDGIGLGIVQALKRRGITVKPIKARGSKEARSETAEIRMAAGQIYFPHGADFLWDLEQELIHFPQGEYADQVDALAHAARLVQERGPHANPKDALDAPVDPPLDANVEDEWT
jgi:predicted phage terminase large subunit-like protein